MLGNELLQFLKDEWENVPTFEPSSCTGCKKQIKMATEAYSPMPDGVQCTPCVMKMVGPGGFGGMGMMGMMDGTGVSGVKFG